MLGRLALLPRHILWELAASLAELNTSVLVFSNLTWEITNEKNLWCAYNEIHILVGHEGMFISPSHLGVGYGLEVQTYP